MRSDWYLPLCTGSERLKDSKGDKAHPTQKPESLLYRVLMASTRQGDTVLDPFFGTGTTGAVAKKLGRHYIGIERDKTYAAVARKRIESIAAHDNHVLESVPKRELPRIPFGTLIERGLIQPGAILTDSQGKHSARVHADGSIAVTNRLHPIRGSIHKVGAQLQNAPSCNGWTYWHLDHKGKQVPIDHFRAQMRGEGGV